MKGAKINMCKLKIAVLMETSKEFTDIFEPEAEHWVWVTFFPRLHDLSEMAHSFWDDPHVKTQWNVRVNKFYINIYLKEKHFN